MITLKVIPRIDLIKYFHYWPCCTQTKNKIVVMKTCRWHSVGRHCRYAGGFEYLRSCMRLRSRAVEIGQHIIWMQGWITYRLARFFDNIWELVGWRDPSTFLLLQQCLRYRPEFNEFAVFCFDLFPDEGSPHDARVLTVY